MMKTFKKEDIISDMPLYRIYMVIGDGWYVANKLTKKYRRFGFEKYDNSLVVLDYAMSIG